MKKFLKVIAASFAALFIASSLAGCAEPEQVAVEDYAMVIDVRTPEEFSDGHLEGAERIGIADSDFLQRIDALDKTEDYYIYCRSGNRAGQAINAMLDLGFTGELVNGGSVGNASSQTGLAVVK
ncbi:MAG: rhodanese-like domain-containing protein [Microbacteriaceae bacterium]|nr:rhodanese-like domain-containing protein [Microbacteriaceae bacterium]MDR9443836.1 rhodanese-like domain-containing protein [Microbacteriaceae bacterium]